MWGDRGERAKAYRETAAECRAQATICRDFDIREDLMTLVQRYEQLARSVENEFAALHR